MLERVDKFIRVDNKIIVGKVCFHRDLLPKDIKMLNDERIKGGGQLIIDLENEIINLFGESSDFGCCDEKFITDYFSNCKHILDNIFYVYERYHKTNLDSFKIALNDEIIYEPKV